jgi:hypothetical protein
MRVLSALVLVCLSAAAASAQTAYKLNLEKPDFVKNGRLVVMGGVSDSKGHLTFIENLSIMQPVDVVLWTLDNDDDIEVALAKDRFDDVILRASSKGRGAVLHRVRTEGDLRFIVRAIGQPRPYRMVVYVGDEVNPPVPSILVPGAARSGGRPWVWIATGVGVTGIAAVVLLMMMRRKGGAAAAMIVLALAGVSAQDGSGPVSVSSGSLTGGDSGGWGARMTSLGEEWGKVGDAATPFEFMNRATGVAESGVAWLNEHRSFTPHDEGLVPDYSPDGSPSLPVGCMMNDEAEACNRCYQQAQGKLNGSRRLLERLRALYEGTKRYVDASVSFGDNVSGIHAATGLAWQAERRSIMQYFEKFERTHEEKRQGMMQGLRVALDEIATCEATYFDNPDWFNRYGFIYYQFMEARYRR